MKTEEQIRESIAYHRKRVRDMEAIMEDSFLEETWDYWAERALHHVEFIRTLKWVLEEE